jgi:cell division protein FtsL
MREILYIILIVIFGLVALLQCFVIYRTKKLREEQKIIEAKLNAQIKRREELEEELVKLGYDIKLKNK